MSMHVGDIVRIMESWAPPWTAWERDAVGLQVGDPERTVRIVGVALDVTDTVVDEALRRKTDMIVCHHPLFFHPPKGIVSTDRIGRIALRLAERRIALFASHTNLDSTNGGVNFVLARALGLKNLSPLVPLRGSLVKVAVFVPAGYETDIIDAVERSGAGVIGDYTACTFRSSGTGTFRAGGGAKPFVGKRGVREEAEELRVEFVVPRASVSRTVETLRSVHPYDEMAYDIYPLENPDTLYGIGAVGSLARPESFRTFAQRVKRATGARVLRTSGRVRKVRTVAVCGGSGTEYIERAISSGADVYVTADLRYHSFQHATDSFSIVDAGHWETEHLVLPAIASRLRKEARAIDSRLSVYITAVDTNPIHIV